MVYLNGLTIACKPILFILTAVLNVAAIAIGLFFVLAIINPKRYMQAAKEIIKESKKGFQ